MTEGGVEGGEEQGMIDQHVSDRGETHAECSPRQATGREQGMEHDGIKLCARVYGVGCRV